MNRNPKQRRVCLHISENMAVVTNTWSLTTCNTSALHLALLLGGLLGGLLGRLLGRLLQPPAGPLAGLEDDLRGEQN